MIPAIARGLKNRFGRRAPMSILAAIAALPRPSLNNLRAAYLEQRRPRFMLMLNWMVLGEPLIFLLQLLSQKLGLLREQKFLLTLLTTYLLQLFVSFRKANYFNLQLFMHL